MTFVPRFVLGSLDLTDSPYAVEFGSQFGAAQNVTDVLNSLLADGELLSTTRTSNREISLSVIVQGADLQELATAEAALALEVNRARNTLTFDPGDGYGLPTVFDTFRAAMTLDRNDNHEMALVRRFNLTIPALPFGRSESLTTEVAEGIPSVGTIVNAGTSLTGWSTPTAVVPSGGTYVTASPQPASMLAVDSGAVAAKAWSIDPSQIVGILPSGDARRVDDSITLNQAISISSGGYLSFQVKFDSTFTGAPITLGGRTWTNYGNLETFTISTSSGDVVYRNSGSTAPFLSDAIIETLGDGWLRYTLRIDSTLSVTSLKWTSIHLVPYTVDPYDTERPRILVKQVAVAESATLGNQILKTLTVGGSARTTGALHVAAPSDSVALGQVIAYTVERSKVSPGFKPDLAQWVLAGATTATVSGRTGVFTGITSGYGSTGSPVFQAPASMFQPGAYTIAAAAYPFPSSGTSQDFTIEASLLLGSTVVATEELRALPKMTPDSWQMLSLGTMYLPPTLIQSPSTAATVRFRFKGSAPYLDEVYAFPVEGDLTIVDCGTGTVGAAASSHLWVDSPSAENEGRGAYFRGATPNRFDAVAAWSTTVVPGTHTFDAGEMLAFAASTGAQGPTVSFDYYKAWMFHAAG